VVATANVLQFLKVNLMQKIWLLMLDEAFIDAYVYRMLITCGDRVKH
jgi:hypothetical protein